MIKRILFLAVWLLFFNLGATTLTNWDEAWLVSVARDGNWNGQIWFYEPPMVTWVLAIVMRLLGSSEFWLRSFFASCGIVIVGLTYLLAKNLSKSSLAGILASLVLLADIEFLFRARQINTDIPLTLFLLLTMWAFVRGRWNWGWIAWGLAFLTKRATPLLWLPGLILVPKRNLLVGLGLLMLVVLPWHGYMGNKFGNEFIQNYILGFTLGKITTVNPATGTSPLFYFLALKHAFKIFVLLLPLALVWAIRQGKSWRVVWIIIATFFTFLTIAPIKASWYLLPVHPLIAIVIGGFLTRIMEKRMWVFILVIIIVGLQLVNWKTSYIVPETTRDQAELAKKAGEISTKIYLDDDYLPVAVWYSNRQVIPLRFNRLPIKREGLILPVESVVLTNQTNLGEFKTFVPEYELLAGQGDLLLIKVRPIIKND